MSDEPIVTDNPDHERYEIHVGDATAGFAAYKLAEPLIAFTHTEVKTEFEGHGLAGRLATHALDASRSAGRQVFPFCPYIRGYIAKHQEYVDLVPAEYRPAFGL